MTWRAASIRSVNTGRVFTSPAQEKSLLSDAVQAATPESVAAAFRGNWPSDHRLVLVTGNAPLGDTTLAARDAIRDVYQTSRRVAVLRPSKAETPRFPYLAPPTAGGVIVRREHFADNGVTRLSFANGVKLNLKPTDFKEGEVLATLIFGDGRSAQPLDKPGLAPLAEALINESGLGGLTKDALEQASWPAKPAGWSSASRISGLSCVGGPCQRNSTSCLRCSMRICRTRGCGLKPSVW